jgi:hypothetical protein
MPDQGSSSSTLPTLNIRLALSGPGKDAQIVGTPSTWVKRTESAHGTRAA